MEQAKMQDKISKSNQELRGKHSMIDTWLIARQELLVEYVHIAGLSPKRQRQHVDLDELQQFCNQLLDYVSTGHFEIYNYMFQAFENATGPALEHAQKLYPQLKRSTDIVLDFNDKYSDASEECLLDLDDDLNKLGPMLENRFDTEDRLMKTLDILPLLQRFYPENNYPSNPL